MDQRRTTILSMTDTQFRTFSDEQFRAIEQQFKEHKELLAANTALTRQVAHSTCEIVEAFSTTKRGAQVLSAIGRFAMRVGIWLSRFLFIVGSLWAIFHGHWPKGGQS